MNNLKLSILVLLIVITACDKIPNGPVDHAESEIVIENISAPLGFVYTRTDSTMRVSVEFKDSKSISNVWLSVESVDGILKVVDNVRLLDNGNPLSGDQALGDNIYSALIPLSKKFTNGEYVINFYAEDNANGESGNVVKVGSHVFAYDNGQANLPPVISDLNIPASIDRELDFIFTVKVSDPNGKADISQVYFTLYRPDNTVVNPQNGYNYFLMDDTGNEILGDSKADDGIYSFKNKFSSTAQVGKWRFEFQAKDRNGLTSNKIIFEQTVN